MSSKQLVKNSILLPQDHSPSQDSALKDKETLIHISILYQVKNKFEHNLPPLNSTH